MRKVRAIFAGLQSKELHFYTEQVWSRSTEILAASLLQLFVNIKTNKNNLLYLKMLN